MSAAKVKLEYGDFQTPDELASDIVDLLINIGVNPRSILEPTCGKGSILKSAVAKFKSWEKAIGIDINKSYVEKLKRDLCEKDIHPGKVQLLEADFFAIGWKKIYENLPRPLLIIGNLPWVTNSTLGSIEGNNLPAKSNFLNHRGFDAISGKSNFDISEWMLIHLMDLIKNTDSVIAILCKTVVARKLLQYIWKNNLKIEKSAIFKIDAKKHFNASVDACLFFCKASMTKASFDCKVYSDFIAKESEYIIGYHNRSLICDMRAYQKLKHLQNGENNYIWRTGIKHDCSKVMELTKQGKYYINGFNERFDLEDSYLYPLLKSSDVANGKISIINRYVIVSQKFIGQETDSIRKTAPKTWSYLEKYSSLLDKRKSSIYKNKPRFSVFAVGDYAFSKYKVAISGFYKKLQFKIIEAYQNKPVMLDDTCNFLSCRSKEEAEFLAELLNSEMAKEFYSSFIFWDSKRPLTIDILNKINIFQLAKELHKDDFLINELGRELQLSCF